MNGLTRGSDNTSGHGAGWIVLAVLMAVLNLAALLFGLKMLELAVEDLMAETGSDAMIGVAFLSMAALPVELGLLLPASAFVAALGKRALPAWVRAGVLVLAIGAILADAGALACLFSQGHVRERRFAARSPQYTSGLRGAVQSGDVEKARAIIEKDGRLLGETDYYGYGVLHLAVTRGDAAMVRMLLSMKADANCYHWTHVSPLHEAAKRGHLEVAELLLRAGAKANAEDREGNTPLSLAREGGYDDMARLLLSYGAKPTQASSSAAPGQAQPDSRPAP